jgi:hypothetical protein
MVDWLRCESWDQQRGVRFDFILEANLAMLQPAKGRVRDKTKLEEPTMWKPAALLEIPQTQVVINVINSTGKQM